jgi:hypothetical protein
LDVFREMVDRYLEADANGDRLSNLVQEFENWARENAKAITENMPEQELLDTIRPQWLAGISLHTIIEMCGENSREICTDLYGYKLSWLFHSIAQELDWIQDNNRVETLAKIGLLVELGLPTEASAKAFLAGVRSRTAAVELSPYVTDPSASLRRIRNVLLDPETIAALSATVSPSTIEWLNMLSVEQGAKENAPVRCAPFQLDVPDEFNVLHVRQMGGEEALFLSTADAKFKYPVTGTNEMPFDKLANDPRYVFTRDGNVWHQQCRDPRVQI